MTDEDGRVVKYFLDVFGRVKSVRRIDAINGDAVWQFTYSPRGEITDVTDPNNLVTHYDYDFLGRAISVRAPDNGTTTLTYNDRSQVVTATDARGVVVTTTYDVAGRIATVLSSNEPAGVRRVNQAFSYYPASSSTYRGRLKGEVSDGVTHAYTYTAEGALWGRESALGSTQRGTVSFTYDPGKRIKTVIYPDGFIAKYFYNLDDTITQITDNTGNVLAAYLYDDAGRVSVASNAYGFEEAFTFDWRGRVTQIASSNTSVAAGDLVDDRMTWSKAGLLLGVQRYGLNVGGAARVTPDLYAMAYDPFGRLTNVTRNGNFFGGYEYDKADRLTRFQEGATNVATPTTFVQDKLTARTNGSETRTWTYDASGNATQDVRVIVGAGAGTRTRNHSWDALGRYVGFVEVGAAQTSYFYTPGGELARVTSPGGQVNSSDYLHVGAYARKDLTTGAWINRIIGANGAVAELRGPRIEMAHKTFGQSVAAVSNDLGAVLRQEEFKPYGKVLSAVQAPSVGPTGGWEERFHGIRGDELMVAGGRVYDAERGSWLSRDPLALGKPSAVVSDARLGAMYGFNNGDPYRYRDPTGRQGMDPAGRGEATSEDKATWDRKGCLADPIGDAVGGFIKEAAHITQCALVGCGIANAPGPTSPTYSSPTDAWYFKNTISYFALGGLFKYAGRVLGAAGTKLAASKAAKVATVTVYRVEGVVYPHPRIIIGAGGSVEIKGNQMLFLNFGDAVRAQSYLAQKIAGGMEGAEIKSFSVTSQYLNELRAGAVLETEKHLFPTSPLLVDATKATDQFGLRFDHFAALKDAIIPGSGR